MAAQPGDGRVAQHGACCCSRWYDCARRARSHSCCTAVNAAGLATCPLTTQARRSRAATSSTRRRGEQLVAAERCSCLQWLCSYCNWVLRLSVLAAEAWACVLQGVAGRCTSSVMPSSPSSCCAIGTATGMTCKFWDRRVGSMCSSRCQQQPAILYSRWRRRLQRHRLQPGKHVFGGRGAHRGSRGQGSNENVTGAYACLCYLQAVAVLTAC